MKKLLLAATAASLVAITAQAQAACSTATVKGAFGFGVTNEDYDMKIPGFTIGRLVFVGVNKITLSNARISDYGQTSSVSGNGTYSLGANCVGSSTVTLPDSSRIRLDFVVTGKPTDVSLYVLLSSASEGLSGQGTARKISF